MKRDSWSWGVRRVSGCRRGDYGSGGFFPMYSITEWGYWVHVLVFLCCLESFVLCLDIYTMRFLYMLK